MVNDDIVTRLRAYNIGNIGHEASSHMEETLYEAADEIERLRAAVRHLYFNEGVCYGDNCDKCELVFGLCDDVGVLRDE